MGRLTTATGALLASCFLVMAPVPAVAQLSDPLSLAASGVVLPFFSDPAAGFVSVLEIASPIVSPGFTNPVHAVFFTATCTRNVSTQDVFTAKQAKAFISTQPPFMLNFNGLAAIGSSSQGNDLLPLHFPLHARTHWIEVKSGRLRELEPIILNAFLRLAPGFVPLVDDLGAGASIGSCDSSGAITKEGLTGLNNGLCWSPLRSAATFVTPQESASLQATIYLICPTAEIQSPTGGGVFPITGGFPRIQNRDGSLGFPPRNPITSGSATALRARIYNDEETLMRDVQIPCTCLTSTPVLNVDSVYRLPPANLGPHSVPVWYTELETQTVNPNPVVPGSAQQFSFVGYWGLEVAGHAGTFFHRMSNGSLDGVSFGAGNVFGNR